MQQDLFLIFIKKIKDMRTVPREIKVPKSLRFGLPIVSMDREIQLMRMQLWIDVAAGVANSGNSVYDNSPGRWADTALKNFDATFEINKK